jgi:hypothetical protein
VNTNTFIREENNGQERNGFDYKDIPEIVKNFDGVFSGYGDTAASCSFVFKGTIPDKSE